MKHEVNNILPAEKKRNKKLVKKYTKDLLEPNEQHFIIPFFSHRYGHVYILDLCSFGELWAWFQQNELYDIFSKGRDHCR